jgi:hypothetical protein
MKKILILMAVTALTLSACSGVYNMNPERLKIDKAYNITANIQKGDFYAVAEFERSGSNMWNITMLEPFALAGMSMVYDNGEIVASYEGLEGFIGRGSVAELVITAFENAVNGDGREAVSGKENIKITSKVGGRSFEMVLDKASHEPLSLKIPSLGLAAEFSQVQVSQIVPVLLPDVDSGGGNYAIIPHD